MQLTLSIDEASAASGIGKTRLYAIIGRKELAAKKCGKRTLILKSDLEAFLTSLPAYTPQNTTQV